MKLQIINANSVSPLGQAVLNEHLHTVKACQRHGLWHHGFHCQSIQFVDRNRQPDSSLGNCWQHHSKRLHQAASGCTSITSSLRCKDQTHGETTRACSGLLGLHGFQYVKAGHRHIIDHAKFSSIYCVVQQQRSQWKSTVQDAIEGLVKCSYQKHLSNILVISAI